MPPITGCTPDELAQEAVSHYLAKQVRFAEAVARGMADADCNDFVPAEEVWDSAMKILKS